MGITAKMVGIAGQVLGAIARLTTMRTQRGLEIGAS